MARSLAEPRPETMLGDFNGAVYHHVPSGRYYEFIRGEGDYRVRRYQIDADGTRFNQIEQSIDFIIGSGNKGQSFAYQTPAGELYELPVVWYPEINAWGMAPGFERPDHNGVRRQITRDCMFCHNAYPDVPMHTDRTGDPHTYPSALPEGIGCQRCHGPGADHVRVAYEPTATVEQLQGSIFNSGRLEPAMQDQECYQCHYQPDSQTMSIVRRPERGTYGHRSGVPFDDYAVFVDHSPDRQADRFQINHHPYRLRMSRCFTESNGALNCLTCHDPHQKVPEADRIAHYRTACLTCHVFDDCDTAAMQVESSSLDNVDCLSCHMVQRRTQDVINVALTDHLIRREPPATDLTRPANRPPAVAPSQRSAFTFDGPATVDEDERYTALAACGSSNAPEGMRYLQALLSKEDRDVDAKFFLAGSLWNSGQEDEAHPILEELAADYPDRAIMQRMYGRSLIRQGEPERGIEYLNAAQDLGDTSAEVYFGRGLALYRLNRLSEATSEFEQAVVQWPYHVDAWMNLGRIHLNGRQFEVAAESFARAHAVDPNRDEAYYFHALALLLHDQPGRGLRVTQHAEQVNGPTSRIELTRATALLTLGRFDEARDAAARGADDDPGTAGLINALASLLSNDRGQAATTYAAIQDDLKRTAVVPELRALLLRQAETSLGGPRG